MRPVTSLPCSRAERRASGGGIRDGDRGGDARFPDSLGLIYANLGTFFADRGFVTIVSDYRTTTSHPKLTFPQGAEDVSLTLEWLATHADLAHANLSNVFVAGNSAGGTHLQARALCAAASGELMGPPS